jgi:hypothetical protein
MRKKLTIFITAVITFAITYWLTCYVNVILGAIAVGLGINVLEYLTKGAE